MMEPARPADLEQVAEIYEHVLDYEEEHSLPFTNWKRGAYPTLTTAQEAFRAGTLWVDRQDGKILGALNLNQVQLPEYARIPWTFEARDSEVWVIHTLVVEPRTYGKGRATALVCACEEQARRMGGRVMRLDTYEGNEPAKRLYPGLGYRLAGTAEFFFQGFVRENLVCFEKEL